MINNGNSNVSRHATRATHQWFPPDEKIGVHSIRIVELQLRATAVLGTFAAADRMLLGWSNQVKGELECKFEIIYKDGRTIGGAYQFRQKRGSRPALMQFVRSAAKAWFDAGGASMRPVRPGRTAARLP